MKRSNGNSDVRDPHARTVRIRMRQCAAEVLFAAADADYAVATIDRIAQICVERYDEPAFVEVDLVPPSGRTAGFGSSGR